MVQIWCFQSVHCSRWIAYPIVIVAGQIRNDRARARVHDFQHALAVPQHARGHGARGRARQVAKHKAAFANAPRVF